MTRKPKLRLYRCLRHDHHARADADSKPRPAETDRHGRHAAYGGAAAGIESRPWRHGNTNQTQNGLLVYIDVSDAYPAAVEDHLHILGRHLKPAPNHICPRKTPTRHTACNLLTHLSSLFKIFGVATRRLYRPFYCSQLSAEFYSHASE